MSLPKTLQPTFQEPVREPEVIDDETGFEFEPVPVTKVGLGHSPFRPDWERARPELDGRTVGES